MQSSASSMNEAVQGNQPDTRWLAVRPGEQRHTQASELVSAVGSLGT